MERELRRYLNAIVILLSLNSGFLVTSLWASEGVSLGFLVIPPLIGAILVGGLVWVVTGAIEQ